MDAARVVLDENECVVNTYGRGSGPVFTHGSGCEMWDADGKRYLDLAGGMSRINWGLAFAAVAACMLIALIVFWKIRPDELAGDRSKG